MPKFTFADRYAEAGISPGAQIITARQAPAERIAVNADEKKILELVGIYYGSPGLDLSWFRDEFAKEDASFSLVNNEREARVLAALILGELVSNESHEAILGLIVGNFVGHRPIDLAAWLVINAHEALGHLAVSGRKTGKIDTKITSTLAPKLGDEVAAIVQNDWAALVGALGKVRNEASSSSKTIASQTSIALNAITRRIELLNEESQMLWWLFGGHSRSLGRSFAELGRHQAALVGAVDLGDLTTATRLGPVAAPAMLERVIGMAKRAKGASASDLAGAVDGLSRDDLMRLEIFPAVLPARIAPVTAAIDLARNIGSGVWHQRFRESTGIEPSLVIEPLDLATQLYREHLLGQLL